MTDKEDNEKAKNKLRKLIKTGRTIYTVVRHVTSNGMHRHMDVLIAEKNKIININYYIEQLGLYKRGAYGQKNNNSLRVSGAGMDMGFAIVYSLSRELYNNGFRCTGITCGSNDHRNEQDPKKDRMYYMKNKIQHKDGGYALYHQQL